MRCVLATSKLANRMHGKSRHPDIQSVNAEITGRQRTDSAATAHISSHHKILHWHISQFTKLPETSAALTVSGIALIGITFNHRSFIQDGTMLFIMPISIVGVNTVRIIRRN